MEKIWQGHLSGELNAASEKLNSSIEIDGKMWKQDVLGSVAHAKMLAATGVIPPSGAERIVDGLNSIYADIESGALPIDLSFEDIHSFIEAELTKRIGDEGGMLHTARSRNDQVATDAKLFAREKAEGLIEKTKKLLSAIYAVAKENKGAVMCGYTHLQRAQPVLFSHWLLAYAEMFKRDLSRLLDARARLNYCPLGAGALAGTTHKIDRNMTAKALGFFGATANSIDSVSDRDYAVELAGIMAIEMMHLSRLSEELVLFSSAEFHYIELSDSFSTGSSIMPQKKNPDLCELTRGKSGRVYGNLISLLVMLKGLPLAYNKDMQEDKEALFDSFGTLDLCLAVYPEMLLSMKVNKGAMAKACEEGYINATDAADYLVKKGMPFRTAYKIIGQMVTDAAKAKKPLGDLAIAEFKSYSPLFEEDVYEEIKIENCAEKRVSLGGTSSESVEAQLAALKEYIDG